MWRWIVCLAAFACGSPRDNETIAPQHRDAIAWEKPVELAKGGGEKGPWQQNESRFDYVDDGTVALADGAAVLAWVDQAQKDVFVQVRERDGRARDAVNVSRTPAVFSWLPRIVVNRSDVFVLWQEIVFSGGSHGGDMFFARSRDGGRTFGEPVNLSSSRAGDGKGRITAERWHNGSFDLAMGPDGALVVAWTNYEGQLLVRRARDGETFGDTIVVDEGKQAPARAPSLAIGAIGDAVYIAWTVGETESADVRIAKSSDGGAFGKPVVVEKTAHYSDAPKLAFADGVLHVVISETSGGPFAKPSVRYTRSRDGATFDKPRTISGREGAGFPSLAVDGGRVFVTWDRFTDDTDFPHGLGIAYSLDGGATFTAPAEIPATHDRGANGSQQGKLTKKLAVRGDAIAVVNSALRFGESSRVWLVRGKLADHDRSQRAKNIVTR